MAYKVFVDGQEGTTGLKILERLSGRDDIQVLEIDNAARKDPGERRRLIGLSDISILCLPDEAARESAALAAGTNARLIDASTAHRVDPQWVYGLPELCPGQRERVRLANRVSVPGCYATAFVLAARPLVDSGLLGPDYPFTVFGISGYSGAGKKLIATYEDPGLGEGERAKLMSPRPYALGLHHKHLPEMRHHAGLSREPIFLPCVGPYYQGMLVQIPIEPGLLRRAAGAAELRELYAQRYQGEAFIRVPPVADPALTPGGFLEAQARNGTNMADIMVFGDQERSCVCVRIDNLGKGASGAAVQCLNLMLGIDESKSLRIE